MPSCVSLAVMRTRVLLWAVTWMCVWCTQPHAPLYRQPDWNRSSYSDRQQRHSDAHQVSTRWHHRTGLFIVTQQAEGEVSYPLELLCCVRRLRCADHFPCHSAHHQTV